MNAALDLELAQASADIYEPRAKWDRFWIDEGIYVALRRIDGLDIVCFRGSITDEDWKDNLNFWPTRHPEIGYCHSGFLEGMEMVYGNLRPALRDCVAVTGHSLGAARALIFAGLLTVRGLKPARVTTFGTPRPGFARLSQVLIDGGYPIRCFKNRRDPITDVPYLGGLYTRPVPQTMLNVAAYPPEVGVFSDHHMPLYLEGVKRLYPDQVAA